MTTEQPMTRRGPGGRLGMVLVALAALWLGWQSWSVNLTHACETRQWPGFEACLAVPAGTTVSAAGREWDRLRQRVTANPGDGLAMAEMARYAGLPPETLGLNGATFLNAIARAAPQRTEVLQQQVVLALSSRDWAAAVPRLVRLSERHGDPEASRALARLMLIADQEAALRPVLRVAALENVEWVDRALRAMVSEKLPVGPALPLVGELALRDAIKPATGLLLVRQLKSEGRWLEAHALWLQLWKRPLDLLYNGDFERDFVPHAFDWEFEEGDAARAGARVERIGMGARGKALRIRFTGQPVRLPLLRHDALLPAGSYRFESEFQTQDLRSPQGLVWSMTCVDGGREIARSGPLETRAREWMRLAFELKVPGDCQAVTLALAPRGSVDARAAVRGELTIDRVRLTRLEPLVTR